MIIYEQISNREWKWDPIMVSSPCDHPISFPEKDHWDSLLDRTRFKLVCILWPMNEIPCHSSHKLVLSAIHIINWKPQGLKCDQLYFDVGLLLLILEGCPCLLFAVLPKYWSLSWKYQSLLLLASARIHFQIDCWYNDVVSPIFLTCIYKMVKSWKHAEPKITFFALWLAI